MISLSHREYNLLPVVIYRIYVCEDCGNIVDRDFNASTNIRDEGIRILISKYNKTTVGHTGSNACETPLESNFSLLESCGEDKVSEPRSGLVVFVEAGKRITPVVS